MKTEISASTRRATVTVPAATGGNPRLGGVPEAMEPDNNNNNNNSKSYNSNNTIPTNRNTATTTTTTTTGNINTTALQRRGSNASSSRLPCIERRRSSGTSTLRKPRAASFNDAQADMSTSQRRGSLTAEGPALPSQRRASVPQQGGGGVPSFQTGVFRRGSKLTFLGAGRRVSMMVKYRQALQGGRGKGAVREGEAEEPNPMEPIRELPHSPRFSTFLSAEAQYAMMKGYEDKLYDRITDSKPEVRSSLQRTKTPFQKITVVDQDSTHLREEDEDEGEGEGEEGGGRGQSPEVKSTTSSSHTSSSGYSTLPASTRTLSVSTDVMRSLDNRSLSPESSTTPTPTTTTTISVPYLKPLRRQSVAGTSPADVNGNGLMMMTPSMSPLESSLDNLHLHRSYSLPSLDPPGGGGGGLSMSKRLVLTYRLESAMDLLDSLKKSDPIAEEEEEHSLSPRVLRGQSRLQQAGDPVKDFNSWTKVWNKEFKEVQSK